MSRFVPVAVTALLLVLAGSAHATPCPGTTDPSCTAIVAFGNSSPDGDQGENIMRQPQAIDFADGRVYVGDRWSWHVQTFDANHAWTGQWGEFGSADGQVQEIGGVTHDSAGDVYVLDIGNNRVQKFGPDHSFMFAWGGRGTGATGTAVACDGTSDPGSEQPFNINFKGDLAFDPAGYVYVADTYNHRVVKFDTAGRYICQIGTTGLAGSDNAHFQFPEGVTVDPSSGHVYVADDQNDRIQEFDSNGHYLATFGSSTNLNAPYDVGVDGGGYVYVADNLNHRVDVFDKDGNWLRACGGRGTAPGKLQTPRNLVVDPVGDGVTPHIFVTDTNNERLQEFDRDCNLVTSSGPNPWGLNGRDGGLLSGPEGIDVTPGRLTIADTLEYWMRVLNPDDGSPVLKFGGHGTSNRLFELQADVAVDGTGMIHVADTGNDRINRFTSAGTFVSLTRGFNAPRGIAVDGNGNEYVADTDNDSVEKVGPTGAVLQTWTGPSDTDSFSRPSDVALSPDGALYVADAGHDRVVKFDASGDFVRMWDIGGPGPSHPNGIEVDANGDVYVTDPGNASIRKYDSSGDFLVKWGTRGHKLGEFWANSPYDVATDASGNVYVSDTYNNRIQKFAFSDKTPPTATAAASPEPNAAGWNRSDVTVTVTGVDDNSGVRQILYRVGDGDWSAQSGDTASIAVANEGSTDVRYKARDNAGNTSPEQTLTVKLDKTAPEVVIATPHDGTSVTLGESLAADYSCEDPGSGTASCTGSVPGGSSIDTATVGHKSFTVASGDNAGNEVSVTAGYDVIYDFAGFLSPVNNVPTLNTATAGSAIPVKFGLHGDKGLGVLTGASSTATACDASDPVDAIETVADSQSGLKFDDEEYIYVWKTDRAWAGSCRQLVIRLDDGTAHRAQFRFR